MFKLKETTIFLLLVVVFWAVAGTSEASTSWKPTRPITMLVTTAPGGAYDAIARQIARVIPDYLGSRIIVQNVPGAGGLLAIDRLIRSKPDGHTFMLTSLGAMAAMTMESPFKGKAAAMKVPISILADPYAILGSLKSPYRSFKDVMNSKKKVRVAVAGTNFSIIGMLAFFDEKKVPYAAARFGGSALAAVPLMTGDADLFPTAISRIGIICYYDGYCTPPLVIFDDKRDPRWPDVPTHIEVGMPKEWSALRIIRPFVFAPDVPDNIVAVMSDALAKSLKDERTIKWGQKAEVPMDFIDNQGYRERMKDVLKIFQQYPDYVKKYFY